MSKKHKSKNREVIDQSMDAFKKIQPTSINKTADHKQVTTIRKFKRGK